MEAASRHGRPEIFNTDQAAQFTRAASRMLFSKAGVAISHRIAERDPFGSPWTATAHGRDNGFVARFWRSVKYEEVYLSADRGAEVHAAIASYLRFYNSRRPHASLDRLPPNATFFNRLSQIAAA